LMVVLFNLMSCIVLLRYVADSAASPQVSIAAARPCWAKQQRCRCSTAST
jgi:hypothetical protein